MPTRTEALFTFYSRLEIARHNMTITLELLQRAIHDLPPDILDTQPLALLCIELSGMERGLIRYSTNPPRPLKTPNHPKEKLWTKKLSDSARSRTAPSSPRAKSPKPTSS